MFRPFLVIFVAVLTLTEAAAEVPFSIFQVFQVGRVINLYRPQLRQGIAVNFVIDTAGTPDINLSAGDQRIDEFEAIELGLQHWAAIPNSGIQLTSNRAVSTRLNNDGINSIFFEDLGNPGFLAQTVFTYNNVTGAILDSDIQIADGAAFAWITSPNGANGQPQPCPCVGPTTGNRNDLQGVVTHEIGHALGLDHSAHGAPGDLNSPTMYPYSLVAQTTPEYPRNSPLRTTERDDQIGLRSLYGTPGWDAQLGRIQGTVADDTNQPLLGVRVIARSIADNIEVSTITGARAGVFVQDSYEIRGLPPGEYELRAEPTDGSGPSLLNRTAYLQSPDAVIATRFPAIQNFLPVYYLNADSAADATRLTVQPGIATDALFRPLALLSTLPRFLRPTRAVPISGQVILSAIPGGVRAASLVVNDGVTDTRYPLPNNGQRFTRTLPAPPIGTVSRYRVEVVRNNGSVIRGRQSIPTQFGLSGRPLVAVSDTTNGLVSVVDSGTFNTIQVIAVATGTARGLKYSSRTKTLYATSSNGGTLWGYPFASEQLAIGERFSGDLDGDGLVNELEPIFGCKPNNPDTDGDLVLDGAEPSERFYAVPDTRQSYVDLRGGVVANDQKTPASNSNLVLSILDVSSGQKLGDPISLPPSGRFRLRVPDADKYIIRVLDLLNRGRVIGSSPTLYYPGDGPRQVSAGAIVAAIPPIVPRPVDAGTDPANSLDNNLEVFRVSTAVSLPIGGQNQGLTNIALDANQDFAFVSEYFNGRVHKIQLTPGLSEVASGRSDSLPMGLAIEPTGQRIYAANYHNPDRAVTVMRTSDLGLISSITMPSAPRYLQFSPRTGLGFVALAASSGVGIIDSTTNAIVGRLAPQLNEAYFVSSTPMTLARSLFGTWQYNDGRVLVLDNTNGSTNLFNLSNSLYTVTGSGVNPENTNIGFLAEWNNSAVPGRLIELNLTNGTLLRTVSLSGPDNRDLEVIPVQ